MSYEPHETGETEGNHDYIGKDLRIRAEVGDAMDLDRHDLTFFCCCHIYIVELIAPVMVTAEIFAALLNPLDRVSQFHRSKTGNHLFGVDVEFTAKTAADLWDDDVNLVLRQAELRGEQVAQQMREFVTNSTRSAFCRTW